MGLIKRYVTYAGANAHDGTTLADAFSITEMATEINTNGHNAGYKYLLNGTFPMTTTSITLTGDGTATSPLVIEGFNSTEGDLYAQGRTSGGALDTTNFPSITFTTGSMDASGANYIHFACLKMTSAASTMTLRIGQYSQVRNCEVTNTGTNSASGCLYSSGTAAAFVNCDATTAATGATYAVGMTANQSLCMGCRIKCTPGSGLTMRGEQSAIGNTIYESTIGIKTDNVSASPFILKNTIVNCTGDGIDCITSSTLQHTIIDNHITGCGGYGIDFNTSTCAKRLGSNRFRDNAGGNINGGDDWTEGTSQADVTSDDADSDDFTNQGSDDYSIKSTAAGFGKATGYKNAIGANGTPAGSGGGLITNPGLSGGPIQ